MLRYLHCKLGLGAETSIFHVHMDHNAQKAKLTLQISQQSDHSTKFFNIQNNHKEHIFKITSRKLHRNPQIKKVIHENINGNLVTIFLGHPVRAIKRFLYDMGLSIGQSVGP